MRRLLRRYAPRFIARRVPLPVMHLGPVAARRAEEILKCHATYWTVTTVAAIPHAGIVFYNEDDARGFIAANDKQNLVLTQHERGR